MAIAPSPRNLDADRSRIRSPLARLRKYIHGYVSLEGAAFAALFVALWFWIGLLLDYGFFKLTLIDWVQTLPWGFRAGVLGVVLSALAALVVTKIVFRLFREFSDAAMALVLERKFPQQLGDRLITAVEMSDPRQAEQLGYSARWSRRPSTRPPTASIRCPSARCSTGGGSVRQGGLVALLTLGLGAFVGAGFAPRDSSKTRTTPPRASPTSPRSPASGPSGTSCSATPSGRGGPTSKSCPGSAPASPTTAPATRTS
ncbi:MAG: hypothetical protein U0797_16645 [Gemmataceae bacterium]